MGGSDSKHEAKEELHFTEEERDRVQLIFCNLSHSQKSFSKNNLQHFTEPVLDHFTSSRLFDWLESPLPGHKTHHDRRHHTDLQHFAGHLAVLLKGHVTELASVCLFLASTNPLSVSAKDFAQFVANCLHSYERLLSAHCTAYQSWIFSTSLSSDRREHLASSLLSSLLRSAGDSTVDPIKSAEGTPSLRFGIEQVEGWLSRCHLFLHVLQQVLKGAFQFFSTEPHQMVFHPRLPQVRDTNWSKFSTILDFSAVLYLNAALPSEQQTQWRLVYSNVLHGHSFARFLQCITTADMPTLMVIKDKAGNVFGGFASIPWQIGPKFTGNHLCFLFEAGPNFNVYKPTGYNTNFMYLNTQQQTLPNGLGMGGQFDYFGLWVDQSFDKGHSRAGARGCTTYGSPPLAAHTDFEVDIVEVWAVGKKKRGDGEDENDDFEDEAKGYTGNSLLDKLEDADKTLLDFVDRGTISDHLRAEPLVEETKAHNTVISPF